MKVRRPRGMIEDYSRDPGCNSMIHEEKPVRPANRKKHILKVLRHSSAIDKDLNIDPVCSHNSLSYLSTYYSQVTIMMRFKSLISIPRTHQSLTHRISHPRHGYDFAQKVKRRQFLWILCEWTISKAETSTQSKP